MNEETGGERPKLPRTSHLLIFLLIVGLVLAGWIGYSTRALGPAAPAMTQTAPTQVGPTQVGPTQVATAAAELIDAPGDGFGIVTGQATPWAVPGGPGELPTPEATPAPPAAVPITLIGPPPDSFFRMSDGVTFYWSSPEPLAPGQQFTVYALAGGAQIALGSIDEANLGLGYQLHVVPGQSIGQPGPFNWSIALEDQASGAIIGQSAVRGITLIADN